MARDINEILALKIRQLSDTQVVYTYYLGSFENFAELTRIHPNAEDGSLAQTRDTNVLYFYNGAAWAAVTAGGVGALNDLTDVTITGPITDEVLVYNGTTFVNGALPVHSIDYHDDVVTAGAVSGQFLKYNGVAWVPATATTPTQLSDLSDIDTTGVTNGNVLVYNSGSLQWEPSAPANPNVLSDLTDVDTAVPTDGQVLTWDNANSWWEPQTPATPTTTMGGLTNVNANADTPTVFDVLYWDGSQWDTFNILDLIYQEGDYKGSFANSTDLSTAFPTASGNNWALVAGDIWIHDGSSGWESTVYEIWSVDASTESELETLSNFDTNNEYTNGAIIADDLVAGKRHKHSSVEGVWFEVLEDDTWHRVDLRMPRESIGSIFTPTDSDASASTADPTISVVVPFDCEVIDFVGSAMVAPTGSTAIFDVHYEATPAGGTGTTIFSTKPTIDDGEWTTETAASPSVLTTTTLSKGGMLHFFIDQVGSTTAGRGYAGFLNVYRID